jgi:hypothetical protein
MFPFLVEGVRRKQMAVSDEKFEDFGIFFSIGETCIQDILTAS